MKALFLFLLAGVIGFSIIIGCERDNSSIKEEKKIEFSGRLDSVSACKNHKSTSSIVDTADSIICIYYIFHPETHKLNIKHENVFFNCCPDSMCVQVSKANDTILIHESDNGGYCGCICLYDLEIEINGIEAKKYLFVIEVGPYLPGQNTSFELDFSKTTSGIYCYKRN